MLELQIGEEASSRMEFKITRVIGCVDIADEAFVPYYNRNTKECRRKDPNENLAVKKGFRKHCGGMDITSEN